MSESAGRRVLILVQNLPVPFDRRVWMEATTLQRAGYRVSVVCPKMKGTERLAERLEGVDIYRYGMPFDPRTKLGFIGEYLYAFLRTFLLSVRIALVGRGFDVIHACNPPETSWIIGRFWRLFGKRYIFDHHDLSPELYEVKFPGRRDVMYRFLRFMERATFDTSTVAIATNESHKEVAVERGGMAPERVFVVRSGPSPSDSAVTPRRVLAAAAGSSSPISVRSASGRRGFPGQGVGDPPRRVRQGGRPGSVHRWRYQPRRGHPSWQASSTWRTAPPSPVW